MQVFRVISAVLLLAAAASQAAAAEFDAYGAAPAEMVAPQPAAGIVIELGAGAVYEPAYEGASDYTTSFVPIIDLERLTIPGLIDIGEREGGFTISPAMDFVAERISDDHDHLEGLRDIDATFIPGVHFGYEMALGDGLDAEIYGELQYAFGGAEDVLGSIGANLSWRLSPQLTVSGGPGLSFAGDDYMDTYFGVTPDEAAATGGRLAAYDPEGGLKSASVNLSVKYEFVEDTFLNLGVTYRRLLGDAADSPIVEEESQLIVSAGLSRKFTLGY
jgi:outer membrane protein